MCETKPNLKQTGPFAVCPQAHTLKPGRPRLGSPPRAAAPHASLRTKPILRNKAKPGPEARGLRILDCGLRKGVRLEAGGGAGCAAPTASSLRPAVSSRRAKQSQLPAECGVSRRQYCQRRRARRFPGRFSGLLFVLMPITSSLTGQIADNKVVPEGPSYRRVFLMDIGTSLGGQEDVRSHESPRADVAHSIPS